jgi:protein-tyrosine phosphatase
MTSRTAVLFVCLGNICRSPLAEAAFRQAADLAGLKVDVDSAGTGDWHVGHPPDPRACAVALANSIDIAHYRARHLQADDFHRFDHVYVMDRSNLADAGRLVPRDARSRPALLLDLVPGMAGQPVADPYYGDESDFAQTWREVTTAAEALSRLIAKGQARD